MLQTVYINPVKETSSKKGEKPTITKWKGVKMIRQHSVRSCVREILNYVQETDLVTVGVLGKQGQGKTTLSNLLGHLIHEMADEPFAIKSFDRDGLMNLKEVINNMEPMNHVIILNDLSFLTATASRQELDKVRQTITTIRHLPGGTDVRIILILNWHYSKGLDKFTRGTEFMFVVQASDEENDNLEQLFGKRYGRKISEFQKRHLQAIVKKKFTFRLGNKGFFSYTYKKPFIPVLFYNSATLRDIVTPTREFVNPICSTCSNTVSEPVKSDIDLDKFADDLDYKFGKSISRQAVRTKCFQNGINVYPKSVKQCMQYIEKYLKNTVFNLEQLAIHYKFDNTPTRLDAKLPIEL